MDPAVSVIVPAHRVTAYIAATLDSVLAQTRPDFEIVVVNDGCPDTAGLERVLESYRDRIVYRRQAAGGPSAARNAGIATARGATSRSSMATTCGSRPSSTSCSRTSRPIRPW